jgi:hypothetical protein
MSLSALVLLTSRWTPSAITGAAAIAAELLSSVPAMARESEWRIGLSVVMTDASVRISEAQVRDAGHLVVSNSFEYAPVSIHAFIDQKNKKAALTCGLSCASSTPFRLEPWKLDAVAYQLCLTPTWAPQFWWSC